MKTKPWKFNNEFWIGKEKFSIVSCSTIDTSPHNLYIMTLSTLNAAATRKKGFGAAQWSKSAKFCLVLETSELAIGHSNMDRFFSTTYHMSHRYWANFEYINEYGSRNLGTKMSTGMGTSTATRTRLCTQISEKMAQYQWDIWYFVFGIQPLFSFILLWKYNFENQSVWRIDACLITFTNKIFPHFLYQC